MPRFVTNETSDEEILFVAWGKLKANQDPKKSILVKENEYIEGTVSEINDSPTYKKIYRLKVKGQDKPVVVTGTTDLNDKMGYGTKPLKNGQKPVEVNNLVRITFLGEKKTTKGRGFKSFEVGVARA